MNTNCVIVAAGKSKRLKNKLFQYIGKYPVLFYSLHTLSKFELIDKIVLVTNKKLYTSCEELIKKYNLKKVEKIVIGGRARQESVYNGLCELPITTQLVIIHDGARPIIDKKLLKKLINNAKKYAAAIPYVRAKETIKIIDNNKIKTLDREKLIISQTPQVFKYDLILKAHKEAIKDNFTSTDDAQLVERLGYKIKIIESSYKNIKITTLEDLLLVKELLK